MPFILYTICNVLFYCIVMSRRDTNCLKQIPCVPHTHLANKPDSNFMVYFFLGYELSPSGYHLCSENKTETTSKVIPYQISYSVRMSCGGWLPWKMCQRTHYKMGYRTMHFTSTKSIFKCCDGYEQVSNYCALREYPNVRR